MDAQPETPQATHQPLPLAERIKSFETELKSLQEKHQLKMVITLDFPIYNQLPTDLQLAIAVINKHDGVYKTVYQDITKEATV